MPLVMIKLQRLSAGAGQEAVATLHSSLMKRKRVTFVSQEKLKLIRGTDSVFDSAAKSASRLGTDTFGDFFFFFPLQDWPPF